MAKISQIVIRVSKKHAAEFQEIADQGGNEHWTAEEAARKAKECAQAADEGVKSRLR